MVTFGKIIGNFFFVTKLNTTMIRSKIKNTYCLPNLCQIWHLCELFQWSYSRFEIDHGCVFMQQNMRISQKSCTKSSFFLYIFFFLFSYIFPFFSFFLYNIATFFIFIFRPLSVLLSANESYCTNNNIVNYWRELW